MDMDIDNDMDINVQHGHEHEHEFTHAHLQEHDKAFTYMNKVGLYLRVYCILYIKDEHE
jgi:hypothetical protein